MVDPFSIATGCVSILATLAVVSKQIIILVAGVRDARQDMEAVSRELVSLELCLVTLQNDSGKIAYPAGLEEHIKAVLLHCGLVVDDITKLLTNLQSSNTIQRIKWAVAGSAQINQLRVSLESHKSALEIALCMTSILMVSHVKNDTELIITQNEEIKQDTSRIASLVDEIGLLRTQLAVLKPFDRSGHFLLERFLESTSCAVSIAGFGNYENGGDESEEEADLGFAHRSVSAKVNEPASESTFFVARRLRRFSFQANSESSPTREPLLQEHIAPRIQNRSSTPASEEAETRPLSSPSTPEEEFPLQQLYEEEPPPSASSTLLGQPVSADIRATTRILDHQSIKASMLARKTLTLKQRMALDIQLRIAVQGIPQGGKGFASFHMGNDLGSLREIKQILDAGADVKLSNTPGFAGLVDDTDRMNALDFEINNAKREDVVELLLLRGSSPNGVKIHTAIKRNDENTLKRLLEYGANPQEWDDYNLSALYWAAERDSEAMIAILLHHGASTQDSVSYENSEALENACKLGHVNAVKALLKAGARTRYPGRGAFWKGKVKLKPEVISLIEQHGGFKKRNIR